MARNAKLSHASPGVRGCCNLLIHTAASRVCLGLPLRQTVAAQLARLQSGSMQFIMNQVAGTPQAKILWERGFFTVGSTRVLQLSLSLPEGTKLYAKFLLQSDLEQPCTEAEVYGGYMLLLPHEELTYYTNSPVGCEFMAELYAIYPEDPVREELLGYAEYRIQGTERGSPKGMHVLDLQGNVIGALCCVISSTPGVNSEQEAQLLGHPDLSDDEWHDAVEDVQAAAHSQAAAGHIKDE